MSLLDLLLPRACHLCGHRLESDENIVCTRCFHKLDLLHLEGNTADNYMARLLWGHFVPERCFSLMRYSPECFGASLIHDLKYHDCYYLGAYLGQIAALTLLHQLPHAGIAHLSRPDSPNADGASFFSDIDLIIPMPLHRHRQRQRGYNQSVAIAEGIQSATGLKIEPRAVVRQRDTPTQTLLTGLARRDNTADAFRLVRLELISGRHILIVDDVMTTGSTIISLAHELMRASQVRISVLTIALATSRVML